jgi:cobalamin biosynthesis Mg chelatase CobN
VANNPDSGPAVDAQGRPVIDPTENVKALNEASTENVKALTEAAVKRLDDMAELRATYDRRLLDQRNRCDEKVERQKVRYEKELREADKELRKAESERIDAIRAVDVGAVQRAAEVAAAQAEALRNQVAAAATASATALGAALDPIQKDIADLRRAQYEAQGQKAQVVESRGASAAWYGAIGAGVMLILAALAIIGFIVAQTP